MASYAFLLLLLLSLTGALEVFISNDPLPQQAEQLYLVSSHSGSVLLARALVEPLTGQAGLGTNSVHLKSINITGVVKRGDPFTANNITRGDIALVSCDPNTNISNISPKGVVETIIPQEPGAVVLYSLTSAHCAISDIGPYPSYFTIRNTTRETIDTLIAIQMDGQISTATLPLNITSADAAPSQPSGNPTPAVAMSILYAVTGIITVLFLVIIATGAWRAHTNPERYGPRTGFSGRPRQSRAKGLARAMLETLPIVKFGDPVPTKLGSPDVELEATRTNDSPASSVHIATESQQNNEARPDTAPVETIGTNDTPSSDIVHSPPQSEAEVLECNLGCSICTEDFAMGEDVRVLPCHHQYHPACIDPWLLNVSGTCPLCRVDLRPVRTDTDVTSPADTDIPPPDSAAIEGGHAHHSRVQRILAMRHAPVHERVATLRQLATEAGQEQQHAASNPVGIAEEARQRRRLADRLRSAFRVRTRTNAAPEEVSRADTASSSPAIDTASESTSRP